MKRNIKKITLDGQQYEIAFDDGEVVRCDTLVSMGKKRREQDGGHYAHLLRFSDGVEQQFIASSETITIPDLSWL